MTDDFDFIKAFADVDVLQVEAVGVVVGRAIGALTKGMIEAGLSERAARMIVGVGMAELFKSLRSQAVGAAQTPPDGDRGATGNDVDPAELRDGFGGIA